MGMASGRVILKKVGKNVGLSNDKLQLIASKIKVCVYIIYVGALCIIILYI